MANEALTKTDVARSRLPPSGGTDYWSQFSPAATAQDTEIRPGPSMPRIGPAEDFTVGGVPYATAFPNSGTAAAGGDFASQVRQTLMQRYGPNADPNFINEQVQYFVNKRNDPSETRGDGSIPTEDYWLFRASGQDPQDQPGSQFMGGASSTAPGGFSMGSFTGGGQYPLASVMGPGLLQPWTTPFSTPGGFRAPSVDDMKANPGYEARLDAGADAIQKSAAAKGTLLTGGLVRDLNDYAQDYASNEYDKVYGRAMGENELAYNRAWNEYMGAYGIYDRNQGNQFNRLNTVANLGQNAAAGVGSMASGYSNNAQDLITGAGNAQAAGTVAGANAVNRGVSNVGNTLGSMLATYYATRQPPVPNPGTTPMAPGAIYEGGSFSPGEGRYT